MKIVNNKAEGVKIAYVGGGSRGWAWVLMNDLVSNELMSGEVCLYDIDFDAAKDNEKIGGIYNALPHTKSDWKFRGVKTAEEALTGADFVVLSILPGTFDEMESDVHAPEKYGIYQSVGDTAGPGGIIRAMRTVPMYEEIAKNIQKYCPHAWVINYTNPMTLCVRTLYRVFPEIKAFGCCHEVFGTQELLAKMLKEELGIEGVEKDDIKVNPISVNHFTWLTSAYYKNRDLFPLYRDFAKKHRIEGFGSGYPENWMSNVGACHHQVKFDLFLRYGVIAAAGDRHLAEFCDGSWYLKDPDTVHKFGFTLTPVDWRKKDLENRRKKSREYLKGERIPELKYSGEEGTHQMQALLGLRELVTNINLPNQGQIPNLPLGAVVETNAVFRSGKVTPVFAGNVPQSIYSMVSGTCSRQEALNSAIANRDLQGIFNVFVNDPLVTCSYDDAKKLFCEMVENTKKYLEMYDLKALRTL